MEGFRVVGTFWSQFRNHSSLAQMFRRALKLKPTRWRSQSVIYRDRERHRIIERLQSISLKSCLGHLSIIIIIF